MDTNSILTGRVVVAGGSEYPCTVYIGDLDALAITTEAPGHLHDKAICYLDGVGALSGPISAPQLRGFTLHPTLSEERRERLTMRLAWHATRASWTTEQRAALRIVPDHRDVRVQLPDEQIYSGVILDLSKTGTRIQLSDAMNATLVGAPARVGKRYASVVRVEGREIAVRFLLPFRDETFDLKIKL